MAKFSNAKVGDNVWNSVFGWGEIISVDKYACYGITAQFPYSDASTIKGKYTFDGYACTEDKYPVLFWNEFHIPNEKEDKKPFDLIELLRNNLEPTEFVPEEHNNTINYSHRDIRFFYNYTIFLDRITEVYFKNTKEEIVEIINILNKNQVTLKQLKQAYKILGWV